MHSDRVKDCQGVLNIIKGYEDIIKKNKKNIICFAYQQGNIFKKFKENRKFKNLAEKFKVTKSTILLKISIVKLIDKHPRMTTSSITLNFLKSYYKGIKNIWKETKNFLDQPRC